MPHAAPPQYGTVFNRVIEPGLNDCFAAQAGRETKIFHRTNEGQPADDSVLSEHRGKVTAYAQVVPDFAQFPGGGRTRTTQIPAPESDAHQFAQQAGVHALVVVALNAVSITDGRGHRIVFFRDIEAVTK